MTTLNSRLIVTTVPMKTAPCPHCGGSGRVPANPVPTLKRARVSANLSQGEVSRRIGVSPAYVSEVEGGTRGITPMRAAAWLQACGAETPWLSESESSDDNKPDEGKGDAG